MTGFAAGDAEQNGATGPVTGDPGPDTSAGPGAVSDADAGLDPARTGR
ncbi:hypothetical protein [Frankia sp. ArI3]|nr:hypothetical protein [Frankia sp. ArI3]